MNRSTCIRNVTAAALALALAASMGVAAAATASVPAQRCQDLVAQRYGQAPPPASGDAAIARRFDGHYSAARDRCFALQIDTESSRSPALGRILPRVTERLWDVDADKLVGEYDAWDAVAPMSCWVRDSRCASRQEWDALVGSFLDE